MFILIERYIDNSTIQDLNNLAIGKGIVLCPEELEFSYDFIKKNWKTVLSNHGKFNVEKYKDRFSEENFTKIKMLIKEYTLKYSHYL